MNILSEPPAKLAWWHSRLSKESRAIFMTPAAPGLTYNQREKNGCW